PRQAEEGAWTRRTDLPAGGEPAGVHRGPSDDVPGAFLAHRQTPKRGPRHDPGSLRDVHLRRDTTSHREVDRSLGAALPAARTPRATGVPSSLLRVTPVHRI